MKKKRYYYKVVRYRGDKLISCIIAGSWSVRYKINKWTEGKNGSRVFIFNTRDDAFCFASSYNEEVWKCEALKPRKTKYGCMTLSGGYFELWWESSRRRMKKRILPLGTYTAEKIKLIARAD